MSQKNRRVKVSTKDPRRSVNYFSATEKLRALALTVSTAEVFLRVWERLLSPRDRQRLGKTPEKVFAKLGSLGVAQKLWGLTRKRAVLEIAFQNNLISPEDYRWLMREIGEAVEDADDVRENIVPTHHLVLIDTVREVYCRGQRVPVKWQDPAKWEYIFHLACAGKRSLPLSREMFRPEAKRDYLSKKKSALSVLAPDFTQDLWDRIRACGTNEQRLDLDPQQIRIFETQPDGSVREWVGGRGTQDLNF